MARKISSRRKASGENGAHDPTGLNVVVVRGSLSSVPTERVLPSGDRLVQLEVTARVGDGEALSVPVAWFTKAVLRLEAGDEVVVLGKVRRRFFHAGGASASRTEVVADRVVPARQGVRAAACIAEAVERLR